MPNSAICRERTVVASKMSEGRRRRGIGQVVGRNVDRLNGCDRTFVRRRDAFLQLTQVGGQGRLITDGGRHASEQGRNFGISLGETEDVIQEQQHVAAFVVAEVLRQA